MDIFCKFKELFPKQIIEESKNFLLIHDGYPLTEGHLLIIPKKHMRCFLELDKSLESEFKKLKNKAINFLAEYYQKPVIFEHGVVAQTILHAHLHFLPTKMSILNEIKKVSKLMVTPKIPYLYYEEEKKYYFSAGKIEPGFLHSTFAKKLKRPLHGPDRAKDLNKWLLSVRSKWNNA